MSTMREFKFFQKPEPVRWRTAMGEYKSVSEMSGGHIYNICTLLEGDGIIPNPYLGKTKDEWLSIFREELKNRNV